MKDFIRKNKSIWILFIIIIMLFTGFIILISSSQMGALINIHEKSLQLLANEKASQINLFFESQKEKLVVLASMNIFKEALKEDPNNKTNIELVREKINELKGLLPGISILTNEGIAVIGEIDLPGTDYSQHPYFLAKRQDITFTRYYDPLRKGDYYAIIGPIYDTTDKSKIIGRIAFDIELNKISDIMNETLLGNEEVYLIDESGLLLSGSKFIDEGNKNGVLIQEIKSDGAKVCLDDLKKSGKNDFVEQHNETVFEYINYMGNDVFGAHAFTSAIGGCVIAEKEADEILKFDLVGHITKNIFKKGVKNEN